MHMCFGTQTARKRGRAQRLISDLRARQFRKHVWLPLLACTLLDLHSARSMAETREPTIITAPAVWAAPASETPLPIRIVSSEPIPAQAMLLVRGLSSAVKLSEGRPFGTGVWVVPVNALPRLRLQAAAEATRSDLNLSLVTLSGTTIAETKLTVFVAPSPEKNEQVPTAALSEQITEADRDFALKLLEKGDQSILAGNLAVAQQFYQRAADRGLPEGAMAMAGTYDPKELKRLKVNGVKPDPAMARIWYQKARKLGSREAEERLKSLP
jgi:hypothetical protein